MPHMPKHMTKGPYFVALGANHSPPLTTAVADRRIYLLQQLRDPAKNLAEIMTIGQVDSVNGPSHVRQHWLGEGSPPNGPTGWWRHWKGEPEKVLRCGIIRAIEVAMGLAHSCPQHAPRGAPGSDPAQRPPNARNLPVDYYWVCGVSRFEVYVNWNPHQVTVIIVTPGFPFHLEEYPDEYASGNGAALDAWARNASGSIFVGQAEDLPSSADPPPIKQLKRHNTVMLPGVVTHRLDESRGGSGTLPGGTP